MSKFIAYIEMSCGNRRYITKIDTETRMIETSSLVKNSIFLEENMKQAVKRYSRRLFPSNYCKIVKVEKFDELFHPIYDKINELYENYTGWDMLDWKNDTEEPVIVAKEIAMSHMINDITNFEDFSIFVANKIGEKNNLQKKRS